MKEKTWYVYIHLFPNGKRYIGITSKRPKARWDRGRGYGTKNLPMANAIKKYGWDNIEHIIVKQGLTQAEAFQMEKYLIKKYKTNIHRYGDNYGYNLTDGGEGALGHKVSDEGKERMRNIMLGKVGADCPNSRPIICDGIEYASLTEFKEKNNYPKGNISGWLLGTAGMPSVWYDKGLCYKDLGTEITFRSEISDQRNRKVAVGDKVFNNLKECADFLGTKPTNICLWLTNQHAPPVDIIEKGLRYEDETIHIFKERNNSRTGKERKCECDGIEFPSLIKVSQYLGVKKGTVWAWLKGKNKMPEQYQERGLRYVE